LCRRDLQVRDVGRKGDEVLATPDDPLDLRKVLLPLPLDLLLALRARARGVARDEDVELLDLPVVEAVLEELCPSGREQVSTFGEKSVEDAPAVPEEVRVRGIVDVRIDDRRVRADLRRVELPLVEGVPSEGVVDIVHVAGRMALKAFSIRVKLGTPRLPNLPWQSDLNCQVSPHGA